MTLSLIILFLKYIRKFTVVLACIALVRVKAQESVAFGMLPNLNLKYSISNDWALNFSLEGRHIFSVNNETIVRGYQFTDLTSIISKKTENTSFGGGSLLRIGNNTFVYRFLQQYSWRSDYNFLNVSHRLRADQTFTKQDNPEFRFRYQTSLVKPLNGHFLNLRRLYFKLNSEILNKLKKDYDLELRVIPLLGYSISEDQRIECGLDYRIDNLINSSSAEHKFWLRLNYFLKI